MTYQDYNTPSRAMDYVSKPNPVPTSTPPTMLVQNFGNSNPTAMSRLDISNLIWSPPKPQPTPMPVIPQYGLGTSPMNNPVVSSNPFGQNLFSQNDRSELNDLLGQSPETQFLQPSPTPKPTPTPPPIKAQANTSYYG